VGEWGKNRWYWGKDVRWLGRRARLKVGARALLSPWSLNAVDDGVVGGECWMYCMQERVSLS
jgi:hypothetical protein